MTTTSPREVITDAVAASVRRAGPGLYGVACSGGADSLALAHATITVAGAANVVVISVDHGLQPGSARQAEQVAAWATGQGAAAVVERVQVAPRASVEAAARDARYAALAAVADRLGLLVVLLGHTLRDQAETVLMRVVRGTGPAGLAGIPAERGRFARPLLAVAREDVDAYVARHGLPAWDDPMNVEPAWTRARFRRDVMPVLRRENPRLDEALAGLATSAAEWRDAIDALARPHARFPIACAALAAQPAAVRKRAIAMALEDAAGDVDYARTHLDAADALVVRPAAGQRALDVPGGRLVRTYDALVLETGAAPVSPPALVPPSGPYALRPWRAGDRMRPARLRGRSRKLSDLFVDAKVPRDRRASARVLVRTTDGAIVWAEHVGLAVDAAESLIPTVVTSGRF